MSQGLFGGLQPSLARTGSLKMSLVIGQMNSSRSSSFPAQLMGYKPGNQHEQRVFDQQQRAPELWRANAAFQICKSPARVMAQLIQRV